MAVEEQPVSSAEVHGKAFDRKRDRWNGARKIGVDHHLDIGGTVDHPNGRVLGIAAWHLQVRDRLVLRFAPEVVAGDGVVCSIEPPRPVARDGRIRGVSDRLRDLRKLPKPASLHAQAGPNSVLFDIRVQYYGHPAGAGVGRRPGRPRLPPSRQGTLQIAPVGKGVVPILHILVEGKADLAQVGEARRLPRLFPGLGEDREEDRRENRNDRHDHEQLDQCERAMGIASFHELMLTHARKRCQAAGVAIDIEMPIR